MVSMIKDFRLLHLQNGMKILVHECESHLQPFQHRGTRYLARFG